MKDSDNSASYLSVLEHKLGMDAVRASVRELCVSLPACELVSEMSFGRDYTAINRALCQTAEMVGVLESDRAFSLAGLIDARQWLGQLRIAGTFIEIEDLSALRRCLRIAAEVREILCCEDAESEADNAATDKNQLRALGEDMSDVRTVVSLINSILTDNGIIKDNASPELRDIRSRMGTIQGRISAAMRRVLGRAVSAGIIEADAQPSMRDGRLVLPVAAMNKRKISGIVHDESATGKTYFIEPAEVVELGNEQRELQIEERREIVKILTELAARIRPELPDLERTFEILYRLDFIRAKALFALKTGAAMPKFVDEQILEWHDARHPILKLRIDNVVPLDIDLTRDTARILVISGPNAGGKSVALKTVGVNQYMVQCGMLPVMDARSRTGVFDRIFVDLGDDQSIDDDLSTYSSHLRNMKYILSRGTDKSLLLIDEFGGGTEPQIGGAIAQALLGEFNKKGMWGIVTTHYQNLKQMAQETPGIVNGAMVYDRRNMRPTYRLAMGNPGSSFAVEIALRTGLPRAIIDEAERIVGSDYFNLDKYLLDITRDRRYWENKRADIKRREKHLEEVISRYEQNAENLRQQRRSILNEAKEEADRIIASSNAAVEKTICDIRRIQAEKEQTRVLRQHLAEKREEIAGATLPETEALRRAPRPKKKSRGNDSPSGQQQGATPGQTIVVGDNVLLEGQNQPGTVLEIEKNKATVSFGVLKMTVPLARLTKTIRKAQIRPGDAPSTLSTQTIESSRKRQLDFKNEIDVRGMRADEAIQAVTYFIDDALQFNAGRVRILHGTGTGALRMAIRQYLRAVAGVSHFHDEDVRFGGAGITVVEL